MLSGITAATRYNFHAVPWGGDLPICNVELRAAYEQLALSDLSSIDVSWGRDLLDSPFWPTGPLALAQARAAHAFFSDATLFVSMGTTVSNAIAIGAAAVFGTNTLIDPGAHQSLHFSCDLMGLRTTRIPALPDRPGVADLDAAMAQLSNAQRRHDPFHTLVLGASTYGGLRLRTDRVLRTVHEMSPMTNIVFDDAWAGIHTFHPGTGSLSPTVVGARLREDGQFSGSIWVTHSAHKTMCAMRQAAYVHVLGPQKSIEATESAMYRHHTSSPSWPIMASLDLARAHAEHEGATSVDRALAMHGRLRTRLTEEGILRPCREIDRRVADWYEPDELRFTMRMGGAASIVRRRLIDEHSVYLPHPVGHDLLANVTIGIGGEAVEALATGLLAIAKNHKPASCNDDWPDEGKKIVADRVTADYLIAYPPGVPIAYPGRSLNPDDRRRVSSELSGGASVHRVRSLRGGT